MFAVAIPHDVDRVAYYVCEAVAEFLGSLRYEVEVVGPCLGDWIPNGSELVADRSEDVRPLHIVSIPFRDGDGSWSSWMRETGEQSACKIFLCHVEGAILVGQFVPPIVGIIPETEIEAMHPIVGAVGGTLEMTERDKAALVLIAMILIQRALDEAEHQSRKDSPAIKKKRLRNARAR